ncbi:MAG: hypothetical protein ACKOQ1_02250, partial [Actinomycetota bacterium]
MSSPVATTVSVGAMVESTTEPTEESSGDGAVVSPVDVPADVSGVAVPDGPAPLVVATPGCGPAPGLVVAGDADCSPVSPASATVVVVGTEALWVVWDEPLLDVDDGEAAGDDEVVDSFADAPAASTTTVITRLRLVPVGSHETGSPTGVWNDSNSGAGATFDSGTLTADCTDRE